MKARKLPSGLARPIFAALAALTASNAVAPVLDAHSCCSWTVTDYGEDYYVDEENGTICEYYGVIAMYYYCGVYAGSRLLGGT
jgi:hypothetical protein